MLLHEWSYDVSERPQQIVNEFGEILLDRDEPTPDVVTWVYEESSFVPSAKIVNDCKYSIISDYIGRPVQAFSETGDVVWETDYDIYGGLRNLKGKKDFIPFRQLGQYEDVETGLYYNRFRYYSSETGSYLSKDPIGLLGGSALYAYVDNVNAETDLFGWYSDLLDTGMGHHLMPRSVANNLGIAELKETNSIAWYPDTAVDTSTLHGEMHTNLINEGVPYHGSKFTGTADDFFDKGAKAYSGITTKGFLKIPGTSDKLFRNLTPAEGLAKLKELFDSGKIPCKK